MISALIHTYNEEKNIERCLSSLYFVNEIVIIDMDSTDSTVKLAKKYKAKIFNHPYTGFVEPARNFGISKTSNKWILMVDADEEIPQSLARQVVELTKDSNFDFYRIPRKNIIFGKWIKHSGWWPDYQIRFFQKGMVSWTEKIHGIPLTEGKGFDLEKEEVNAIIHHNYQSLEQYLLRLNRYTSIMAKDLFLSNCHFHFTDLFDKPTKEFINRFFVWEGYKDGIHGLALGILQSFSEVVTYLKLWELEKFKEEKLKLGEIAEVIKKNNKLDKYWIYSELLKGPHSFFEELVWKIKRKY